MIDSNAKSKHGVPYRRNRLLKWLATTLLNISGWKIEGEIPNEPKMVMIGAPHTSNWDFILGLLTVWKLELEMHWVGKHTIFIPPFRRLFAFFGGIPVNRSEPGTLFRDILNHFERNDSFLLAMSPEGTRQKVSRWKPGFHRIAQMAGVPVLPAGIDFATKTVQFGTIFQLTDDFDADVIELNKFFNQFTPRHPGLG